MRRSGKSKRMPIFTFLMCLIISFSNAQTTLISGDIAFTGFNSNDNTVLANEFSFVILRTGGIASGTAINFTDNGWNTKLTPAAFGTAEGIITWTTPSAMPQFSEVKVKVNTAGNAIVAVSSGTAVMTASNFIFSQGGDQVLAYQGNLASPSFLAGLHYNAEPGGSGTNPSTMTGWDDLTGGASPYPFISTRSGMPAALTGGVNAIMVAGGTTAPHTEYDNGVYNCTGSSASTLSDIRNSVNNPANWVMQNITTVTVPSGCTFVLGEPAVITAQPNNSVTCSGGNANFAVSASNPVSYQWQINQGAGFSNIENSGSYSGVTSSTLEITGATPSMTGNAYRVIVTGSAGAPVTSNQAVLTVNSPPSISTHPSSMAVCEGSTTSFTVSAAGSGLTYQWQADTGAGFSNLETNAFYSGENSETLAITDPTAVLSGNQYRVIVSGTCAPASTSNAGTLTVNTAPSVTDHPVNSNICPGENTTFTVGASGSSLSYQWLANPGSGFVNITDFPPHSGTSTETLIITGATEGMNGFLYKVLVTGICGNAAVSDSAILNTADEEIPVFTFCPADETIEEGVYNYTSPTAIDNCSDVAIELFSGLGSGSHFPVGQTTEVYKATDGSGNAETCSFTITATPVTGIGKGAFENGFKIHPNPASDNIFISSTSVNESVTLIMTDQLGKTVKQWELEGKVSDVNLSLEGLQKGVYFITIFGSGKYFTEKILVK